MRRIHGAAILALLGIGWMSMEAARAATVTVQTVLEGRAMGDDGEQHPAILLVGKGVKGVTSILLEPLGTGGAAVELPLSEASGKTLVVFTDEDDVLVPGEYTLSLRLKAGSLQEVGPVQVSAGGIPPNVQVPDTSFSAYSDLLDEGKVGASSSQVAPGNHRHDADYAGKIHAHDAEYPRRTDLSASDGTPDQASDPVHWTRIQGMPAGLADGDDVGTAGAGLQLAGSVFSVVFAGTGTASSSARSDHDHDAAYPRRTDLGTAGTLNDASNPVDWTRIKGVPTGVADGVDDVGVYTAGAGLSLAGSAFSVSFGGAGSATTASRSDHNHDLTYAGLLHDHDGRYYTQGQLNTSGSINSATNPMDWTKLKGVPSGFADGTDDDTIFTAGTGLSLTGTVFSVVFGGNGSTSTVARGDHSHDSLYAGLVHEHDTRYYTQAQLNGTTGTLNATSNPVDWTQLKSVPTGFADGTDNDTTYTAGAGVSLAAGSFSVSFGGPGVSNSASRSDHDHDARYFTQTELGGLGGTLNATTNPVDWNKLKGVPSGFADGVDDGVALAGSGSATTGARSDHNHDSAYSVFGHNHETEYSALNHNHDTRYYQQSALNAATGTINTASNPVDWSQMKSVPAGFADGTDDGATFDGTGTASTAARSDHHHNTGYLALGGGSVAGSVTVTNASSNSVTALIGAATGGGGVSQVSIGVDGTSAGYNGTGVHGLASNSGTCYGVYGETTDTGGTNYGVFGKSVSSSGTGGYFTAPNYGIVGASTAGSGTTWGIQGSSASASGYGGWFTSPGIGLYARTSGNGVALAADHTGTLGNIAEFRSNGTTVASIDRTGLATFNGGISGVASSSLLSAAGTINTATNPVDWTKLKSVPAGFADGVDDSLALAGTGSAGTASKSDHNHDSLYLRLDGAAAASTLTVTGVLSAGAINMSSSTQNPIYTLTSSSTATVVYAYASSTSGSTTGVLGGVDSTSGIGVQGNAPSSSGSGIGVRGIGVTGVSGIGTTGVIGSGTTYGVAGGSTSGYGVWGAGGTGVHGEGPIGVEGISTSTGGGYSGVYGETQSSGASYGVRGKASSTTGYGGYFESTGTTGVNYGVYASSASSSGIGGYFVNSKTSGTTYGVSAKASSGSGYAVYADNDASSGSPFAVYGRCSNGIGVMGDSAGYTGVFAQASGSGNALIANLNSPSTSSQSAANLAVFQANSSNKARIDANGQGFFNGGTATSGADFAESVAVDGPKADFEPGDVMVIDVKSPRRFSKSSAAESRLVAGVYATKPGVLARNGDVAGSQDWRASEVPMAVVGIVPTKVCDEGGPVAIGDMLVTASIPGYAKKAPEDPRAGTVLGKALGELAEGRGVVEVLLGAAR